MANYADQILKQLHALGAVLANTDWETPINGEDLQYFGFLIQDLADEVSKRLSPFYGSEVIKAAAQGGE